MGGQGTLQNIAAWKRKQNEFINCNENTQIVCCCNARDRNHTALMAEGRYADGSEGKDKGKGKSVTEHANEGILASAHADPLMSVSPTPRPLYPCRKECAFPIKQEATWTTQPVTMICKTGGKNSFRLSGFEPRILKPAVSPQHLASPATSARMQIPVQRCTNVHDNPHTTSTNPAEYLIYGHKTNKCIYKDLTVYCIAHTQYACYMFRPNLWPSSWKCITNDILQLFEPIHFFKRL